MSKITLQGSQIETVGKLPDAGSNAPDFTVVKLDLSEAVLKDYSGKKLVLNIFPSIDTPTCAMSVRKFNEEAAKLDNTAVLCISADLPFAAGRFCGAEGIKNVETGSVFRYPSFGTDYGVEVKTGPLKGLLSRAVVIINEKGEIIYTEQVSEIADEPDYKAALSSIK